MTRKSRIRLIGAIERRPRGPAIITDDGETWIIELSDGLELPASGMVVLEGVQAGLDRLRVDWVGIHPNA